VLHKLLQTITKVLMVVTLYFLQLLQLAAAVVVKLVLLEIMAVLAEVVVLDLVLLNLEVLQPQAGKVLAVDLALLVLHQAVAEALVL
jgi:hypothetical protein